MNMTSLLAFVACAALAACSTPYSPPVVVKGSPDFIGLADLLSPDRPLDVILVHGMCTHDVEWATDEMARLGTAMTANVTVRKFDNKPQAGGPPRIELVHGEAVIAGSKMKMTGILWSPLTAALKQQLRYDNTGQPTDCSTDGDCKPKRAAINGVAKDKLLNDCLSDAMAYQGSSRDVIRTAMVEALEKV